MNSTEVSTLSAFPSLDNTYGAILLGGFLTTVLYGVIVLQTYRYIRSWPTDAPFIRTMVSLSFFFETGHTLLIMHALYHTIVTNYSRPDKLHSSVWSLNFVYIFSTFATISSQLFFARRVSLIAFKFKIAAVFTLLFFATRLGCAIYLTFLAVSTNTTNFLTNRLLVGLCAGAVMMADIMLTGSLLIVLKGRTRPRDETRSHGFVFYVINTGLLVTITDILAFILATSSPGNLWWTIPSMVTTRLYMTTLLSVLNSRKQATSREEYNAAVLGRQAITRATRLATIERWNLPQTEAPSDLIDIKVTTEVQGDVDHAGISSVVTIEEAEKFRRESM